MNFSNKEKILWDIIVTFGRRYPTSPEINKIYLCKGDNVNLRTSPSLEGKIAGKIIKDDILIQLEKSMDTSQIGDVRDYWYRIVNLKGLRGWIFGKFLSPYDVSVFKKNETDEKWSIEENFTEWEDSHTPKNWTHIPSAEKSSINFTAKKDVRIATINSPVAKSAGLFTRYNASRAFTIQSRAKYITGKSITIFVYVLNDDKTFYIKLKNEEIDVSGRSIPIHTSDWHEYMLTSEDGKFASLYVDGELISGRIPPVTSKKFPMRGIYCLFSSREEESKGEMEFIKVK